MSTDPAIVVDGLSKKYILGEARSSSLREAIATRAKKSLGMIPRQKGREFWALKDVSFSIPSGQMVGIVGNNGAGKSTLLKILSRITLPTEGQVQFAGRIGSLLEVGTGFHPELSGRDNVFLNGVILGMSQRDVARRFDEIVEFAGIGEFIDTPVKRYSSGMYLRLAFAVAAHLDSEILLVDEVLAVGDIAFQKKCMARMNDVTRAGRTVLFVSHNLTAVQALCQRIIWLAKGNVVDDGPTATVLSRYLRQTDEGESQCHKAWSKGEGPTGGSMELREVSVRPNGGGIGDPIDVKTPFIVEFVVEHAGSNLPVTLDFKMVNEQDQLVFNNGPVGEPAAWAKGTHRLRCAIPADLLNDGMYRISLGLNEGGEQVIEAQNVLALDVLDNDADRYGWFGKWDGVIRPRFAWEREMIAAS
ncbi:polysaccharide ABC transporter ATP-binding protein [Novosphingobium mangrovi (ex Huang et al. 2023)]|uniref:Polysaccharide ABC transporter ATP-binding protein n=1 Tax=Novosphingobium mangrovi (ex Huang et al. 2023) TaxID=2976432 RepID=A0ABT2I9J5_9SPHN|nr:polysaccharide ABC transporter ATP-binding protein [Novosphingobium mangrovi (ex Huang et al. 2023)]MCT2401507.1 polysaccharide ABC transporter ATP-binding protein [Novosphingobium mangrovi (ex Huang et al. 2023)]